MVILEQKLDVPYGILREYELVSTRVRLFYVKPNSRTGPFQGHKALASMVMAGDCYKTSSYETKTLSSGSVGVMKESADATEIIAKERGVSWFHFELNEQHQYQIRKATGGAKPVQRSSSPSIACSAIRLLKHLRFAQDDSRWDCENIVDEFVGEVINNARAPIRDEGIARRLQEIFLENFDRQLEVGAISRELGRNPSHLGRAFKNLFGCSPGEFLRRVRFQAAMRQLTSDKKIIMIACDCGFADESHFCRIFKRYSGYSPSEWRRLCKPRCPE
jgi:AraC-like DNA-binding protein